MSERLIDVVAEPGRPGISRWRAVTPSGVVAGVVDLRPVLPFDDESPVAVRAGGLGLDLHVEPRWRRRGIGSTLLTAVVENAVGLRLVGDVAAGSAGESFCLRHGFRRVGSWGRDLLPCCDVHRAWLGELVDVEHPRYRLRHWTGDLRGAAGVEHLLRRPSHPGEAVVSAAETDGGVVAYALATTGSPLRRRARQYGPVVLVGHRGRRLGVWVNAALIQRLCDIHPHVEEIETRTADGDLGTLALRRHLGFHPVGRSVRYELALP
ncbi:GNAT family N-acetyltransferase [Micromonospora sp. DT227]|uniref:GNAT family N-acetyltransferase n=1 Tax=Micromonospora sp. DT227 TaxID=3393433 RepID=UPI003CE8D8AC